MADKKDKGWIQLERAVWDLPFWNDKPFSRTQAYIDLRLMANHADKKMLIRNQIKIIRANQLHTSIQHLADRWGWSTNRVKRYLLMLKDMGLCTYNGSANGTTVTLINIRVAGFGRPTNEPTNEPTSGPASEPSNGLSNGPQTIMYKNDIRMTTKNEKEEPTAQSHFLVGEDGKVVLNSRGEPVEV